MRLLDRIAHSNGNPQRTIAALRLINAHLAHELAQRSARADTGVCPNSWRLSNRLQRAELQQAESLTTNQNRTT